MQKTIIFLAIMAVFQFSCFAQSQHVEQAPSSMSTPQEIARWLSRNFTYEMEWPDNWQSSSETARLKKGDCEDFAVLSQALLARLGIKSDIVIIRFKDLKVAHAICAWKYGKYYSFMSTRQLYETNATSIEEAVEKYFPDWQKIIFTDAKKHYAKVITRK
ncbi:MAG: hypothetical protein JW919_05575 [Candidatus Omnitrophica bacterium]|nr:hypothetical protein [Candidatus Omnitrophota bacterium]